MDAEEIPVVRPVLGEIRGDSLFLEHDWKLVYVPGVVDQFGTPTPVLDFIIYSLTYALAIGLIGIFLILLILVPIALLKKR